MRQPLGFHQGMEAWTRTPKSPLHTRPQEYLLKEKKRCFLPLKLSCASWSNWIPLSFPKNQSAPLRPTGKHFQVLVVGRTKADQAVAAQGALPELSLGFAAREGGVGSPRCHGDDPLGKEGRSTASSPHARGLHSLGSYSRYRIHPLPFMIHIALLDRSTPPYSLCLKLAQAAV